MKESDQGKMAAAAGVQALCFWLSHAKIEDAYRDFKHDLTQEAKDMAAPAP